MKLFSGWKNVSISRKLYFVVGLMAFLIVGELLTLRFAMRKLSAARAFVGAESLWSKAQKNAVFSLQRFGITKSPGDFEAYLKYLKIPEGDHLSRIELQKKNPDLSVVRQGFIQGHLHPEDIEPIVDLLRNFHWISYLKKAIEIWTKGDELLFQLKDRGFAYRSAVLNQNQETAELARKDIKKINEELTDLEESFSQVLGEGSRWLEYLVLTILTLAVLTVETIGLSLAFMTSRHLSRGLNELNEAAHRIGQGDFNKTVEILSEDEIGQLGKEVNKMGSLLRNSYGKLEERVKERTIELSKMAEENEILYREAKEAVQTRDDFLSVASHELKTPLTSLYLQLQRLERHATRLESSGEIKKLEGMVTVAVSQMKRISNLVDELLDLTKLRIGKFKLHLEECDIVSIVKEALSHLSPEVTRAGISVTLDAKGPINGHFDVTRVGQVVTNLLSNAIKYGEGKPIHISIQNDGGGKVSIKVIDKGPGIATELQSKVFERYERFSADKNIAGLGLGLFISKQIVNAHGGKISVQSKVGAGSTFTVEL